MKTRSSRKGSAVINLASASGTPPRPNPLSHHCKSPLTEPESPLTDPETLKVSKFGKRTRASLTTPEGGMNRPSCSPSDKRRTNERVNPHLPLLNISTISMDPFYPSIGSLTNPLDKAQARFRAN
jgi:hypothetical protein